MTFHALGLERPISSADPPTTAESSADRYRQVYNDIYGRQQAPFALKAAAPTSAAVPIVPSWSCLDMPTPEKTGS